MTSPNIRPARARDAAAVAALHAHNWRTYYRGALRDDYLDGDVGAERLAYWTARLSEAPAADAILLVAEDDDGLLGFAGHYLRPDDPRGHYLDNLHVAPRARGRGFGAALLRAAAREQRARGATDALYLYVLEGNEQAFGFYRHLGGRVGEPVRTQFPGAPEGGVLAYPVHFSAAGLLG